MRFLKYFVLLAALAFPAAYSQAQVSFGVRVGGPAYYGPGYAYGPPVCSYGYYDYAPYACAPYGYWGPDYFVNGFFIGAGPWFRGFGRDGFRRFGRNEGFRSFNGGSIRNGNFRGSGNFRGTSNFQGSSNLRGNGNFRGTSNFQGGNARSGGNAQGGGNFRGGGNSQGGGNFRGGNSQGGGSHGGGGSRGGSSSHGHR